MQVLTILAVFAVGQMVTWQDVAYKWLEQGPCYADLNNDKIVNYFDLAKTGGDGVMTRDMLIITDSEKICDVSLYSPFNVDESRGRIFCFDGGDMNGANAIYITTDGQSFNLLVDRDNPSFASFATDLGVPVLLFSLVVLDDGAYLLSVGKNTPYCDSQGDTPNSKLYRSADGGITWTAVLDMKYGYTSMISWSGIDGEHIVVGEYGPKTVNTARQVFLSHDYGQTWETIYDFGHMENRHIHCCMFDPTSDHDKVYVSYGDEPSTRGITVLTSGMPWMGAVATNKYQPTHAVVKDDCIYWLSDNYVQPVIVKFDCVEQEFSSVFVNPGTTHASTFSQYAVRQTMGYYYNIKKCGDLYYIAGHLSSGIDSDALGVFVSPDLEHWTSLVRHQCNYNGFRFIAGVLDGKLFVSSNIDEYKGKVYSEPTVSLVNGIQTTPEITNLASVNNSDSFEFDTRGWYGQGTIESTMVRTTEESLHGDYSLKFALTRGGNWGVVRGPNIRYHLGYSPLAGDYITMVAWVKKIGDWSSYKYHPKIYLASGTTEDVDIDTVALCRQNSVTNGWHRLEVTAKVLVDFDDTKDIGFGIFVDGENATDAYMYVDCVQYYVNKTQLLQLRDFVEGTVSERTVNERLTENSVYTWFWSPLAGSEQFYAGTLPIAQIKATDGSYVDIYWDSVDSRIKETNGNTIVTSRVPYLPHFADTVMFEVKMTGNNVSLVITDVLNGTYELSDIALSGNPKYFIGGKNANKVGYGSIYIGSTLNNI